jgi:hypothetical protein
VSALTERQHDLLAVLSQPWAAEWARPMDLGASNGSHHSTTLRQLVRRGLVERIPRALARDDVDRDGTGRAKSWLYRITAEGRLALEHEEVPS